MSADAGASVAEIAVSGDRLADAIELLVQSGFRLDSIEPADAPAIAMLSGHGLRVRLDGSASSTRASQPHSGAPTLELTRAGDAGGVGRAGMRYRDVLPSRRGGRFIASHISIDEAGPVADYVHHHDVSVQVIYCLRGWVRVVYEDQGPPFVLEAGDCVLQPPGIRHRVLESSAGLEVLEFTSPAHHTTMVEHELTLPTPTHRPDRRFDGQRFVRHRAADASWGRWWRDSGQARDAGVGTATGGQVGVRAVRPSSSDGARTASHDGELVLWFVLDGAATLQAEGRPDGRLTRNDVVAIPPQIEHALVGCSGDLELVEVTCPDTPNVSSLSPRPPL